ncbi:MAG TPA: methylated-DNA--[protein]-cysteine S-methyltransferase [Actinomycetota bacterium]|nr:methylated-DNA--[protein]-cysteine S-methyltransferase [Actinomycetota bacterium]
MNYSTTVRSPIGVLTLTADDDALTGLHMGRRATDGRKDPKRFADLISQLDRYWARELRDFEVELRPTGTPFQLRVWEALRSIPYGTTVSYGEIARRIESPRAVRAVGRANGSNPIAIVVPCHRVIGANGTLTGYGGGLPRKTALLRLEGALP